MGECIDRGRLQRFANVKFELTFKRDRKSPINPLAKQKKRMN